MTDERDVTNPPSFHLTERHADAVLTKAGVRATLHDLRIDPGVTIRTGRLQGYDEYARYTKRWSDPYDATPRNDKPHLRLRVRHLGAPRNPVLAWRADRVRQGHEALPSEHPGPSFILTGQCTAYMRTSAEALRAARNLCMDT